MAKKKNTDTTGFDSVLNNIYGQSEPYDDVTRIDDQHFTTPLVDDDDIQDPPVNTEDGKDTDVKDPNKDPLDDDSPIPDDILDNVVKDDDHTDDNDVDNEPSDDDVNEAQQISLLFDAVGQSLGWDMAQINDDDKPVTVDELTQYLVDVVNQNSVPHYADERVQKLDEYVKNGGKFEDFYQNQQSAISFDNLDLEDEANQKSVIRELLKLDNYTDEQINKKIARYEDSDMLYEESEDALDRLKQIKAEQVRLQAEEQERIAKENEARSKQFFDSVTNDINSLTNIRGIAIPKEDRKALFDYIFKVDQTGMSQYQKDFNENLSKNLIESAYFTMKADALISNAKKDGETSAAEKLRKMLRHSNKNHSKYNIEEKQKSVVDLASGLF